ncbi:MAG: universal stress protein [Verrucomicrobia bacterium]|nr:universal stress protein [Verrucomicrobiota bacterium]
MEAKKNIGNGKPTKVLSGASRRTSARRAADDEVIELVPSLLKLQTILVPTDFSKESKKALLYAIPFARQFNAGIILLHVVQPHYIGGEFGVVDFPVIEADLQTRSQKELATLAAKSVRDLVPVKTLVRAGSPVNEIVEAAKESKADLVILSTHGRTGLKHVLLGSVAENVVRHAPCPVLIVRAREREFVNPEPRF